MASRSPLRVNAAEEQASYRKAVAEILRTVQTEEEVTLLEISEKIDVSLGTISNAANKKADLSSVYLNRIGQAYGPHYLDPYAALSGGRMIRREPAASNDILPALGLIAHRIAVARSRPGAVEHLPDQLAYLPDLVRIYHDIGALICAIEKKRDAA